MPRSSYAAWGGTALAAVGSAALAVCFVVPFLPGFPRDELFKTTAWSLAILGSAAGWGSEIARRCWPHERVSLALRAVWGLSAFAFVGGVCAMVSGLSRVLVLGWLAAGAALLVRRWFASRSAIAREAAARLRATRLHLPVAAVIVFLGAAVGIHYLGGASDVSSNPFDDDLVYYPFAKQLLERGTLIDPFSFRRMSTLGGQALHHAALLVRVAPAHLNVFDRSMCLLLAVGLLSSHRIDRRKAPLLARLVGVAFLVALPNTSINSASYYSGLAFFLAFFQTLERLPDATFAPPREAVRRLVPLALTGAALCTLRQNYQAAVALVLLFSYGFAALRFRKTALVSVLLEGAICAGLLGLFIVPWLVLLYRSSDTFLFPVMRGTFREGVHLQSQLMTRIDLVRFFADVWLHPDPIATLPLIMLVGLSTREQSARRPLAAQWLGAFVSIVLLVQSFTLSDAVNLARYDYGFATASALLTWHAVAANAADRRRSSAFAWGAPIALMTFALSAPLLAMQNGVRIQKMLGARLRDTSEMLRRSVPAQSEPPVAAVYRRLQEATPAGARLLVQVDEPYYFDYARNEIWNLDMPGTASPRPGIPCFQGPEPVAEYLRTKGVRFVVFVRSERSRYQYRQQVWLEHLFGAEEIWRIYAPYMLDVMENLAKLADTRVLLHEAAGIIVMDLEGKR